MLAFGAVLGYLFRLHRAADLEIRANAIAAENCLKLFHDHQMMFRLDDLDGKGVPDFWTKDLRGFLTMADAFVAGAAADATPGRTGAPPVPYVGYLFTAMNGDDSCTPPEDYRQDTDGKSGRVHHRTRFGFCAFPAPYDATRRLTVILNEQGTTYARDTGGKPVLHWPPAAELQSRWRH
jgi:hypothetical protein